MRILIAEDDEVLSDGLCRSMRQSGYAVDCVKDGMAANTILSGEQPFDLVILDLGMPGMGGHRCLQEIRRSHPQVKVLIASGYAMNGPVQKSMDAGAAGYIGKPYQVNKLLQTVRDILDGAPPAPPSI